MSRPLRVVQWATGTIGSRALRGVIRHPGLELVGVLVTSPAKEGRDAGDLCDEPPTGVLATTDKAKVLELAPDCVLYMPLRWDLDEVVAMLAAGINVVTTRGELLDGGSPLGDEDQQRVLDACTTGGSSAYATGSSPGFVSEVLPLALLSIQRTVERVSIEEFADLSQRPSPELLFDLMGFGAAPESFDPGRAAYLMGEFGPSLRTVGRAAGHPVDEWSSTGEVAVARRATRIVAGELAAGTVAAQRMTIVGASGGSEVVRFTANWYCTADVEPAWDLGATGWRVRVVGDAPLVVELPFPVAIEDMAAVSPSYTANRPVNSVPWVCAAAPGILRTIDLPAITPAGPCQEPCASE
ncbi:MAG: dihydrodipicolinate reductase [Mycobacteriales bacterium]